MAERNELSVGRLIQEGMLFLLPGTSTKIRALTVDDRGHILWCSGTAAAGALTAAGVFAKGCLYIKTDAGAGTAANYENTGTVAAPAFTLQATAAPGTIALANTHILVGNAGGIAVDVAMSGDATVANTGALTIANSAITDIKVSASAAIAFSKLAALTSGNILVGSAGNVPTAVAMSGDATIIASGALTVANNAITRGKLANTAQSVINFRQALTPALGTTGAVDCYIRVMNAGTASALTYFGDSNLAANDTNYVTFTMTNLTGAVTMLDAAGANNTTKVTGGTALTAEVSRALNLTATPANLVVAAGDILKITMTATGTLANAVNVNNFWLDMTGTT